MTESTAWFGLVDSMLALHKQLAARISHEQMLLQRQIDATDKQIDRPVYELYDLTEDEIAILDTGLVHITSLAIVGWLEVQLK